MRTYRVEAWQRDLHVGTELVAIALVPWLLRVASRARGPDQAVLRALAYGTLLVDGILLWSWLSR